MILDTLANSHAYEVCHKAFPQCFAFLRKAMADDIAPGRYTLDGNNVYASVQEYTTKRDSKTLEAHREYIDIQLVLTGKEEIVCAQLADCREAVPYDGEKDAAFYTCSENKVALAFQPGSFGIFFPWDAHAPGLQLCGPSRVKKIVVKVRV